MMDELKQIGEVAAKPGINPKIIRYYEEIGVILKAQRTEAGSRVYDQQDMDRIAFILSARTLNFSLDDIRQIITLREGGKGPCTFVSELADKQIADIEARINALIHLRGLLEQIRQAAQSLPLESTPDETCICDFIEKPTLAECDS